MGNDFLLHKDLLRAFLLNIEFGKEAYIAAYSIVSACRDSLIEQLMFVDK